MTKKVVVLGGGVSGKAADMLAKSLGFDSVIVTDDDCRELPECDLIVASPGVAPLTSELYRQSLASGKELISEMEFGFRSWGRPVLAVTGTNGKTTTTALLTHLLKSLGYKAESAGNIGLPLSDLALNAPDLEVAVVEVSSFQLELVDEFAPLAAVLLNLASDHIDRYRGGFAEYCRIKKKIFDRVRPENRIWGQSFGHQGKVKAAGGKMIVGGEFIMDLDQSDLPGPPNEENLAAAVELLLRFAPDILENRKAEFITAINSFRRDAHRIETIAEINGVRFVDDSKGTNPSAVIAAIDSFRDGMLVMMMGGLAKGMDFSVLADHTDRFRLAVLFGQDRKVIAETLQDRCECIDCGSDFEKAFFEAVKAARPGDTILLSPGCASMDMFKNYKERGCAFRKLAENLRML